MLINLTNHPFDSWTERQRRAALAAYGQVTDWLFPNIPPEWTLTEVSELADELTERLRRARPAAVHLAGEHTFVFQLALRLRATGIPCVASTTERRVQYTDDGKKVMEFRFVAFRPYFAPM